MTCERGEIVLVRFVFSDERGAKRRPALVLSSELYNRGREDLVVAAVTSNIVRLLPGDCSLTEWEDAGLPRPSVVTGIIRTIRRGMVIRPFGHLTEADLRAVDRALASALGLAT